jgi:hypothetical protein
MWLSYISLLEKNAVPHECSKDSDCEPSKYCLDQGQDTIISHLYNKLAHSLLTANVKNNYNLI